MHFGNILVSDPVARALHSCGYETPTPVQAECILPMLEGRDIVGKARTGTGKTAAFGVPMAHAIDSSLYKAQSIVLVPTRELAIQVSEELRRICQFCGLKVTTLYGGEPIHSQLEALRQGTHIVVGTPGRVLDHLSRQTLKLDSIRLAVVDEVDQMFDVGFSHDIERILGQVSSPHQTAFFSATIPISIQHLISRHLNDPIWVNIPEDDDVETNVEQVYYEVAQRDKLDGLEELLKKNEGGTQTLIFRRTQVGVDRLVSQLRRHGYNVHGIHGGMTQPQRSGVMRNFRSGKLELLVATNVAARGLDIPSVSQVINFDMPVQVEEYVHRIGRTGRMGRNGSAVTFVSEWDFELLKDLLKRVGHDLKRETLDIYDRNVGRFSS
ncbi:DEAD/DEAH box helicase [Chloroflexota bacterium]